MKKILAFLAFFVASFATYGQQATPHPQQSCAAQIPYGLVQFRNWSHADVSICRQAYILLSDTNAKIPVWVSYTLTPPHATGCVPRSNAFEPDQSLPKGSRAELSDYAKSGYDIGHQANDGDMSWDVTVEHESFILSNMAPQLPGFNRGIWKKLEDQIRGWAIDRQHTLLVYVGPVYSEQDKTIGANKVVVAHAFYKIVVDTVTNEVMAFEFPHAPSEQPLSTFLTTVQKIEQDTGLIFPLPANATFSTTLWPATGKNAVKAKQGICHIH
jgi:endonuclease G